jgi:uncharacterized protein YabE (DUF348 family)
MNAKCGASVWITILARGDQTTEEKQPKLEADIRQLVDDQSQVDPQLRTTFKYARTSTQAARDALIEENGYTDEVLPTRQTIGTILNQMDYRIKNTRSKTA